MARNSRAKPSSRCSKAAEADWFAIPCIAAMSAPFRAFMGKMSVSGSRESLHARIAHEAAMQKKVVVLCRIFLQCEAIGECSRMMQPNDAAAKPPQISLRWLFAAMVAVALFAAATAALKPVYSRTVHQLAIDAVWGLDGSAMADANGDFTVSLCGNGIRVDDRICDKIVVLQETKKLSVTQAQVTDRGVADIAKLQNVVSLNLHGCNAITDQSVPILGQMVGLKELWLSQTGITSAGVQSLRMLLPHCTIHE